MPVVPVPGSSRALLKQSVSQLRKRRTVIAQEVACVGDCPGTAVSDEARHSSRSCRGQGRRRLRGRVDVLHVRPSSILTARRPQPRPWLRTVPPSNAHGHNEPQIGCQRPSDVLAVGGCGSCAGDGHEVSERACEERRRPASPEHVGRSLAEITERVGPFVVAGDQDAEPGSLCLEEALVE